MANITRTVDVPYATTAFSRWKVLQRGKACEQGHGLSARRDQVGDAHVCMVTMATGFQSSRRAGIGA